ncbi:DUF3693 domain-containing protein [Vibrio fluvialis]|uniref:DUF3693 domain-containing protein n=1 Tax=Vibrio fluvialis TaxID=676 RepID=UPI001ED8D628|nr:DUF3693 domain-containing protein [Vibrio fluvialis]
MVPNNSAIKHKIYEAALGDAVTNEAQQAWQRIAKKYNGLGISGISMALTGFVALKLEMLQCALWY